MRLKVGTFVLVGGLLLGGTVWAQSESASSEDPEEKKETVEEIAKKDRSLVEEDIESLSGDQKLNRAQQKIQKCKSSLEKTNALLKDARKKEKDIRKINCINDKQAAIKGFLKVAEQSYVKLKTAVSAADTEEANHHYTLISVSNQKIEKLTEEARLCAGDVQRYAEGTKVDVDVDDDIAEPPAYLPEEAEELVALPELTPFQ